MPSACRVLESHCTPLTTYLPQPPSLSLSLSLLFRLSFYLFAVNRRQATLECRLCVSFSFANRPKAATNNNAAQGARSLRGSGTGGGVVKKERFRLCNSNRKYVDNIRQATRCGASLSHRIRQQAGIRHSRSKSSAVTNNTLTHARTLIFCYWQLENSFLPALPAGQANLNQILAYRIKQKCRKLHKLAISTLPNSLPITSPHPACRQQSLARELTSDQIEM